MGSFMGRVVARLIAATTAAAVSVFALPATAQQESGLAFSLGVGSPTLGATLEPELRFGESFGLRLPIGIGAEDHRSVLDSPLNLGKSSEGGVGLFLDFYPFGTGLRLGGGVVATGGVYNIATDVTSVDPLADSTTAYAAGATSGSAEEDASVRTVMTMGYTGTLSRLTIGLDLGVMVDPAKLGQQNDSEKAALATSLGPQDDNLPGNLEEIGVSPFLKIGAKLSF